MYAVNGVLNSIDPNKTIDGKICKSGEAYKHNGSSGSYRGETTGKCGAADGSTNATGATGKGLSLLWDSVANNSSGGGGYDKAGTDKMGDKTSATISKDITELNRDEKGKMSSAFARGYEGAEIVEIRSISTTSVMVNACYDVLAEGLPVSPYGCAGIGAKTQAPLVQECRWFCRCQLCVIPL